VEWVCVIAALRQRWEQGAFLTEDPRYLVVSLADDTPAGWVLWRDLGMFGRKGWAWEIGILLAPEHRGRGVGTTAQILLAQYLFETTVVHRLCAITELDNQAEQRSLEKVGFRREGVHKQAGFRGGVWRDCVIYAYLRDDQRPATSAGAFL
jgi:ribosomal-protein-alanine N-acetyltransferase